MLTHFAIQIVLETEQTNTAAMKLYERLGFLRSKRLHRYYLNGNSAYRLVLYLKEGVSAVRNEIDSLEPFPMPPPGLGQTNIVSCTTHSNGD